MAKDAKGHGSESRGGGVAISGGKLITGINKPVRGSSTGVAISGGKLITGVNKPGGGYRGTVVSDMTRSEFIAKHGTTAEKADANIASDKQAAAVLAQGGAKSAPVDVHPAMASPRTFNGPEGKYTGFTAADRKAGHLSANPSSDHYGGSYEGPGKGRWPKDVMRR